MYRVVYKYRGAVDSVTKEFADYVRARKFFWYASRRMPGVSRVELITPKENSMLLKAGDKVKLTQTIKSTYACDDWKTGVYEVKSIMPSVGQYRDVKNPRMSYYFKKCKPGGGYTKFMNGYSTDAFDQMIEAGQAVILESGE